MDSYNPSLWQLKEAQEDALLRAIDFAMGNFNTDEDDD